MAKTLSLVKCSLRLFLLSERKNLRKTLLLILQKTESQLFGYWEHSIVITIIQINGLIISHFLCSFSFLYRGKRKAFIQLQMRMPHNLPKPKGNILIFTIFILFASALLGILVSIMMRDFLKYSNEIAHYHQANVLAKSASEL